MEKYDDFVRAHPRACGLGALIIVILIIVIFSMGIGLAAKEGMLPWQQRYKKEKLFSGDLTPSEQAMFNRLAKADPTDTSKSMSEYMNNKQESPRLTSLLYQ